MLPGGRGRVAWHRRGLGEMLKGQSESRGGRDNNMESMCLRKLSVVVLSFTSRDGSRYQEVDYLFTYEYVMWGGMHSMINSIVLLLPRGSRYRKCWGWRNEVAGRCLKYRDILGWLPFEQNRLGPAGGGGRNEGMNGEQIGKTSEGQNWHDIPQVMCVMWCCCTVE